MTDHLSDSAHAFALMISADGGLLNLDSHDAEHHLGPFTPDSYLNNIEHSIVPATPHAADAYFVFKSKPHALFEFPNKVAMALLSRFTAFPTSTPLVYGHLYIVGHFLASASAHETKTSTRKRKTHKDTADICDWRLYAPISAKSLSTFRSAYPSVLDDAIRQLTDQQKYIHTTLTILAAHQRGLHAPPRTDETKEPQTPLDAVDENAASSKRPRPCASPE